MDINGVINQLTHYKMNRSEAKELLPIIQAFAEGRTIQLFGRDGWTDLYKDFIFDISYRYRIKPEPKYRPFKDADECWQEMLKHEPFGWVRNKFNHNGVIATIICLDSRKEFRIHTNFNHGNTSEDMINSFIFADGAPFGILEEE